MSASLKIRSEGARLYFGTSERLAKLSPVIGIQPGPPQLHRQRGLIRPRPNRTKDALFLTTFYGAYFALCNSGPDERWGIVEIEAAALDRKALSPDEDLLRQLHLAGNVSRWQDGLTVCGTCVYRSPVSPALITRVAIYDPASNDFITREVRQGIPGPADNRRTACRNRALARWFMGENITCQEWTAGSLSENGEDRNEISAAIQERSGLDIFYYRATSKKALRGQPAGGPVR